MTKHVLDAVGTKMLGYIIPVAHAQTTIEEIRANFLANIINPIVYLLFGLALVVFLWGMVEFIAGADDTEKAVKGKSHILWGLIGLAIIMSVFGIMSFICNTIGACS